MYGHLCVPLLCLSLSLFTRVKRFFASDKSVAKEIIDSFACTPFKPHRFTSCFCRDFGNTAERYFHA